jgi:antitoxin MazE
MIKKLTKHGNSLALVIDRPVLDQLQIDSDTPLEMSIDGHVITIVPVRDATRTKKIEKALKKVNNQYGRTLKNLAK